MPAPSPSLTAAPPPRRRAPDALIKFLDPLRKTTPFDDMVVPLPMSKSAGGLQRVQDRATKEKNARDALHQKLQELAIAYEEQCKKAAAAEYEARAYAAEFKAQEKGKRKAKRDAHAAAEEERKKKRDAKRAKEDAEEAKRTAVTVYRKRKWDNEPADSENLDDTKDADDEDLYGPSPNKRQRQEPSSKPHQQSQSSSSGDFKGGDQPREFKAKFIHPASKEEAPVTEELKTARQALKNAINSNMAPNVLRAAQIRLTWATWRAHGWPIPPEQMPEDILQEMHADDRQDHRDLWAWYEEMQHKAKTEEMVAKAAAMDIKVD